MACPCTYSPPGGSGGLRAQTSADSIPDTKEQLIEDVIASEEPENDVFEYDGTLSLLDAYRRRPLNLNRATYEELTELLVLSPVQVDALLEYRQRMGRFVSIYELQAVPGMDLETIRNVTPFVNVNQNLETTKIGVGRMMREGDRVLFVRTQARLEEARGYRDDLPEDVNQYLGNSARYYVKFRQQYGNRLSFGVVAEKDPGEPFFSGPNRKRGFDYYSAHFFLREVTKNVKAVALGDFNVSFGQGLILYTGFGFGKSSQTTTIARGGQTLRPYASVNEFNFMRGAGVTLALGDQVEFTAFGSRRLRDGNQRISITDSLDAFIDFNSISTLDLDGFHRTAGEIEDRNALTQISYGGSLKYQPNSRLRLAANFLSENLSTPLDFPDRLYNRFNFRGTQLYNGSVDYRYRLNNFTFLGEVAASDNGGTAMVHVLQSGLSRYVTLALAYRRYERDYQALSANAFGETFRGQNEEGAYLGLQVSPAPNWRVNAYYDFWVHPWFRFNIDGPSGGREYRLRVNYFLKRKLDTYIELRGETKGFGTDGDETIFTNLDPVVDRTRFQARFHFDYRITPFLSWRTRVDGGFTEDPLNGRETGYMLYQDFHFRPRGPLSFSARFAVFNTDGFNVRFYQYENGLLYNARVIPYYNKGTRSFLVVRYKGIRGVTIEGRIAQTFFSDGTPVGSGLEATEGSVRTEVGGQVVWRF